MKENSIPHLQTLSFLRNSSGTSKGFECLSSRYLVCLTIKLMKRRNLSKTSSLTHYNGWQCLSGLKANSSFHTWRGIVYEWWLIQTTVVYNKDVGTEFNGFHCSSTSKELDWFQRWIKCRVVIKILSFTTAVYHRFMLSGWSTFCSLGNGTMWEGWDDWFQRKRRTGNIGEGDIEIDTASWIIGPELNVQSSDIQNRWPLLAA